MKILNVGCGGQTYGTHFIDFYPRRPEVKKCDVENEPIPFEDDFFDEVYADNIFEHLVNPGKVLREMLRVLKRGGRLVVITDNASYWAYHLGARTHYGGYEERSGDTNDRHYALYTSWHLANHFKLLGLEEVQLEYLLIASKHSTRFMVNLITRLMAYMLPHIAYPQIKITGIKP